MAPRKQDTGTRYVLGMTGLVALVVVAGFFFLKKTPASRQAGQERPFLPDAETFAQYAGSPSCRQCHQEAFDHWAASHHGLAERNVDPALDRVAFDPHQTFQHGTQTSEARVAGEQFEVVTMGRDGTKQPHRVERVIGVKPLIQFLVAEEGGRHQVTEVAFDPHQGDWFNIFEDEDRVAGEWGHWTGRGMNWNTMCAACHNTRVRKNYDPATDTFSTTMAEPTVSCEACHGPMADHVAWQRKRPQPARGDPTIRRLDRLQLIDSCGACHARRSELTGDFQPGDLFLDHHMLVIPDETDIYFPDGQVRDENYEYTSFLSSKMFMGGVRCIDCHEPHSAKTRLPGNALCMQCHGGQSPTITKIDPATHSFHKPGTSGYHCVDCHMPLTTYMARHPRRDHGFTIPDPLLTKEHGIPNACNRCHTDKTVEWSIEHVDRWYGEKMNRPSRERARTVAEARAGGEGADAKLLALARDEENPLWRAVATGLLRRWADSPLVTAALIERAADSDPLTRAIAARGLDTVASRPEADSALRKLLDDPVRAVRIEAAWTMRQNLDTNSMAGTDLLRYLRHNLDQPSTQLQSGTFHLDRDDLPQAMIYFKRAVSWDPNSAPLRNALAVALSMSGDSAGAVAELETACRLAPQEAEYRFRLGLALNESGNLREATAALRQATELDPQFAQAWYNLGLAYSALGQLEMAVDALEQAEAVQPGSPMIPYARATVLARLGRMAEAREAAQRALQIQPSFTDAAALLRALSQR